MLKPRLIYCDGKNKNFATIAIEEGYYYGARLPSYALLDYPLFFSDVDWKSPDEERYISDVITLQPRMATVIDIENENTLQMALKWASLIADVVDTVIFIPKIPVIDRLPTQLAGKEVILGYSVPTSYGKTDIDIETFLDYRIHLLGGSPHSQMRLFTKYPDNIYSVDGNYHTKMITKHRRIWTPGNNTDDPNRFWKRESEGSKEALFRQACINIRDGWQQVIHGSHLDWLRDKRFT